MKPALYLVPAPLGGAAADALSGHGSGDSALIARLRRRERQERPRFPWRTGHAVRHSRPEHPGDRGRRASPARAAARRPSARRAVRGRLPRGRRSRRGAGRGGARRGLSRHSAGGTLRGAAGADGLGPGGPALRLLRLPAAREAGAGRAHPRAGAPLARRARDPDLHRDAVSQRRAARRPCWRAARARAGCASLPTLPCPRRKSPCAPSRNGARQRAASAAARRYSCCRPSAAAARAAAPARGWRSPHPRRSGARTSRRCSPSA